MQSLIALCLAVTLAVMSLAAASARGQTSFGGRVVVLCSGGGLVQLTLDADGQPSGDSHLCPDLVLVLLSAHVLPTPDVLRPEGRGETLAPRPVQSAYLPPHPVSRARAPPVPA